MYNRDVSIYEMGDSLVSCETNFKNLLNNWTSENIINAAQYFNLNYSFVETILDSVRYRHYRNYFTGEEPVGSAQSTHHEDVGGQRINEIFISPSFRNESFYDPRKGQERLRTVLSDDFRKKVVEVLMQPLDVDTMDFYSYKYHEYEMDSTSGPGGDYGYSERHDYRNVLSPNPISQGYIDVMIKKEKDQTQLTLDEYRALILEGLLIEKVRNQLFFNRQVSIGDKVYRVEFWYGGRSYTIYVICSTQSNKVVMDLFFRGITLSEGIH